MITLQQMRYAIEIAEMGSFNKAADSLFIAQPSLSSPIQSIEKELGFHIFTRTKKGVTLTADGEEFISYARQLVSEFEDMMEHFGEEGIRKQKFGVSAQHYSFAVKAFVEMTKAFDVRQYEFAIRETKTKDVISDVRTMRSEIGILYLSDFNRKALMKLLTSNDLVFHRLISCKAYVFLWAGHPLAKRTSIGIEDLSVYPCISFEQGDESNFFYAEELLSTSDYQRTIKVCDRATALNLMVGLNAYTLCSGIICQELNGPDYVAVPLAYGENREDVMEIGYIIRKESKPSKMATLYIEEIMKYLKTVDKVSK